jgi:hypothetical protein
LRDISLKHLTGNKNDGAGKLYGASASFTGNHRLETSETHLSIASAVTIDIDCAADGHVWPGYLAGANER